VCAALGAASSVHAGVSGYAVVVSSSTYAKAEWRTVADGRMPYTNHGITFPAFILDTRGGG
jgi:hypothetical protein